MGRRYKCNDNIFNQPCTETQFYWIGFLAADGHITKDGYRLNLKLGAKDINHVEKFRSFIEATNPIENDNGQPRLRISSPKIITDLRQFGIVNNKSLIYQWPEKIPRQYQAHFIRGYIDRDGYWGSDKAQYPSLNLDICGTPGFLEKVSEIFRGQNLLSQRGGGRKWSNNAIQHLAIGGNRQSIPIACYLYKDSTIYLVRKREIIENFLKDRREHALQKYQNYRRLIEEGCHIFGL
jgi:hypothetical protein